MNSAKENILKKIRKALTNNPAPMPFPEAEQEHAIYTQSNQPIEEVFVQEFQKLGGKFVYCANENELVQQLTTLMDTLRWNTIHCKDPYLLDLFNDTLFPLKKADQTMQDIQVGISTCECIVARTGSVVLSAAQPYGRALPVYAPIHITVAFANQVVWNLDEAIQKLQDKYQDNLPSMISLTTGPSRTADIEKTLVVGVHGPKEVYVFYIDETR
ncbi:MAG: lactate utilization protein [Chitinophagaceae bacterium]